MTSTSNGRARGPDGRFGRGNEAARVDGLRATSRKELQRRSRRVSLRRVAYLKLRAEAGRPLWATQLPIADRYCELTVLALDWYAKASRDSEGAHLERYLAVTRALIAVADKLGETATVFAAFERGNAALQAEAAVRRLRQAHAADVAAAEGA